MRRFSGKIDKCWWRGGIDQPELPLHYYRVKKTTTETQREEQWDQTVEDVEVRLPGKIQNKIQRHDLAFRPAEDTARQQDE